MMEPATLFTKFSIQTYNNQDFKGDYIDLIRSRFPIPKPTLTDMQIKHLIETAALFALSRDENHRKLALKISLFLLELYKKEYDALPFAAELVLARMGDIPAIATMVNNEKYPDYFSFFSTAETYEDEIISYIKFPEILIKKTANQVSIGNNQWQLTDFQIDVFYDLLNKKNVTFTAPTSAGKSFVVYQYIAERVLKSDSYCAIYVVPTKSLIAEIHEAVTRSLRELSLTPQEAMVFNSADHGNIDQIKRIPKKVIVLTQERLQQLISSDLGLVVDLLVIDEAQKISDSKRGVIIEDSIQELVKQNPSLQKIIISPNTADPHRFPEIFNIEDKVIVHQTQKTPVGQNFFFVDFGKREVNVSMYLQELDQDVHIQTVDIDRVVSDSAIHYKKIWTAEHLLKDKGHTLIYCNGPAECRKVAEGILKFNNTKKSAELQEGIEFLRTHVHPDYYLVDHLEGGVGYHYGKMPQFVRLCVKQLFDEKKIDFLCCTSTLLEGVNLPAKNIVLYKPKSGPRDKMDKSSVLNLAGRAGRLAKDYYGNVYCLDYEKWQSDKDIFDGKLEKVRSAVEKTLIEDIDLLLEHLTKFRKQDYGKKNVETIATSLLMKQLKDPEGTYLRELQIRCSEIPDNKFQRLKKLLKIRANEVEDIKEIALKNRSIDPRLQFELYKELSRSVMLELPMDPSDVDPSDMEAGRAFYNNLMRIFEYISTYLLKEQSVSYKYYALIAKFWLSQMSYKRILESNLNYAENVQKQILTKKLVNKIIDELDETLETALKYDYSRGLKCYCDLLTRVMKEKNDRRTFCTEISTYLEAGASDPRIFLLLSTGLSRNSAVSVYEKMDPNVKDISACIQWLRTNRSLLERELHPILFKEIESLVGFEE